MAARCEKREGDTLQAGNLTAREVTFWGGSHTYLKKMRNSLVAASPTLSVVVLASLVVQRVADGASVAVARRYVSTKGRTCGQHKGVSCGSSGEAS